MRGVGGSASPFSRAVVASGVPGGEGRVAEGDEAAVSSVLLARRASQWPASGEVAEPAGSGEAAGPAAGSPGGAQRRGHGATSGWAGAHACPRAQA